MSHFHDHVHSHYTISQLSEHIRAWHEGDDSTPLDEPHGSEHTVKVSNKDSDAGRIDIHPWAAPLFEDAEVVFASLEGVQKADAILSAIRQNGLKASVYSVPSVTLWADPQTPRFAKEFLAGKTVVVVPDSDWSDPSKKGAVENQARIYHGYLLSLGVPRVHIAAPPNASDGSKQGVDDHLGAGGTLGQLVCIDVAPPDYQETVRWFEKAVANSGRPGQNIGALVNMTRNLAMFSAAGERGGLLSVSQNVLANVLGVKRESVKYRLASLAALGAITYEGSLEAKRNYFGTYDWTKRPTITVVPEELQAVKLPERTLAQVLGESFFGLSQNHNDVSPHHSGGSPRKGYSMNKSRYGTLTKAHKEHKCSGCEKTIEKGEDYVCVKRPTQRLDRYPKLKRFHLSCHSDSSSIVLEASLKRSKQRSPWDMYAYLDQNISPGQNRFLTFS